MSEERKNLHLSGIGLLRPSDIGGEACEGCEHNQRGESCALVLGSGEALRSRSARKLGSRSWRS